MRATRAYLAGFGTAGCLLAASAVLFLLASAFVSFEGFPDVSANARVGQIVLQSSAQTTPVASRRVLLAFPAPAVRRAAGVIRPTAGAAPRSVRPATTPVGPTSSPTPGRAPSVGSGPVEASTASTASESTSSTPTPSAGSKLGSAVTKLGSNLNSGVKTTTTHLNGTVSSLLSGTGTVVSKVSPSLGSAVPKVSSVVTGTVTNVTSGVTTTVAQLTGAVGHLLGAGS